MKKTILLLLTICSLTAASAQSIRSVWTSMPSNLIPYLDKDKRTELIDLVAIKTNAEVVNLLGETCKMDTLTATFLSIKLSTSSSLQLKLLPTANRDTVICIVETFFAPAADSRISLYTKNWQKLPSQVINLNALSVQNLTARPDSMSTEEYEARKAMLDPLLIEMTLSPNTDNLILKPSQALLNKDEQEKIKAIILQRKTKWNGAIFN